MGLYTVNETGQTLCVEGNKPGRELSLKIENVSDQELPGAYDKSKIETTVNKAPGIASKHKVFALVKKACVGSNMDNYLIGGEKREQTTAERYYEKWRYLRKIGIPTVTSMRILDKNRILMGDMTVDGSGFIDKSTYQDLRLLRRDRKLSRTEELFLEINPALIEKEIEKNQEIAWDNGIRLPDDNEEFSIWIHPDGTWKVLVVDLSYLRRVRMSEDKNDLVREKQEIFERLDFTRQRLLELKERMRK